jgi:hypothetical protein
MAGPFGKGAVPHAFVPVEYVFPASLMGLLYASMNLTKWGDVDGRDGIAA